MLFGTKEDIDTTMHSLTPGGGQWSPLPGFLTDLSWEWTLRLYSDTVVSLPTRIHATTMQNGAAAAA